MQKWELWASRWLAQASSVELELELRVDLATCYIFTLPHTKSKVRSLSCSPSALETDWQCLPKGLVLNWSSRHSLTYTPAKLYYLDEKHGFLEPHSRSSKCSWVVLFFFSFLLFLFFFKFQTIWKTSSNDKLCETNPMEPFLTQNTPGTYEDLLEKVRCREIWGIWKQLSLSLSLALSYINGWSYLLAKKRVHKAA